MAAHRHSEQRTRRRREKKSEYFLKPGKQGAVSVFRRPAGNRIDPKLCGTMPSKALALALMKQLEQAESVVSDLFLEATDDGIEALEAILRACRESVERRAARHQRPALARQGRIKGGTPQIAAAEGDAADPPPAGAEAPPPGGAAAPRRRRPWAKRRGRPERNG